MRPPITITAIKIQSGKLTDKYRVDGSNHAMAKCILYTCYVGHSSLEVLAAILDLAHEGPDTARFLYKPGSTNDLFYSSRPEHSQEAQSGRCK